jgi:3'5'-cyclic nucleotide phosphodiesterase
VKESSPICAKYRNQSVAEQNSVDIGWALLLEDRFNDLRATIYSSKGELTRFRQLIVNTVLATDIVDKDLKELRNSRWERAFHQRDRPEADADKRRSSIFNDEATNRKATIVIEHIIQASDIAHTMQHWHVYRVSTFTGLLKFGSMNQLHLMAGAQIRFVFFRRGLSQKWNERFFNENMQAYLNGRMEKDPSLFWYKGEIGFFDFYIIPLAKKLEECGVFGVSSHEYRQYALANREEWVSKGEQIVAEMKAKYGPQDDSENVVEEQDTVAKKDGTPKPETKKKRDSPQQEMFKDEIED